LSLKVRAVPVRMSPEGLFRRSQPV